MPRRPSRAVSALLAVALSAGCGGGLSTRLNLSSEQWHRTMTARGLDPAKVQNPLQADAEMRTAALAFAGGGADTGRLERLQEALFDARHFTFDYDPKSTYTAREAFAKRRGNCVAFTNLFIAMARAIGITVQAGFLARGKTEKEGDLVFVNQHVVAMHPRGAGYMIYDFYRLREGLAGGVVPIDDLTMSGIYFNNLGVESMRQGRLDEAQALVTTATRVAPEFPAAHGNLGVILRRKGDLDGARVEYDNALRIAPKDPTVLSNLASLYTAAGKHREARAVLASIAVSEANPYTLLVRGDLEMAGGRIGDAIDFYARAHRLEPRLIEPLLATARAEQARRNPERARKAIRKALRIDPKNEEALRLLDGLTTGRKAPPAS